MKKNSKHILYIFLLSFLFVGNLFGMKRGKKTSALYKYFGIEHAGDTKFCNKDVRGLIAKYVIGNGGWWYPAVILPHNDLVNAVTFHPDKDIVATGSYKTAVLWDLQGNKKVALPHNNWVNAVTFHPDKDIVATGSYKTAVLWDLQGNKKVALPHNNWVKAVTFHPDKDIVATGSWDKTAVLWDLQGNKKVALPHNNWVKVVAFHPDKDIVATGLYKTAVLWDLQGNKKVALPHNNWVRVVTFHPHKDIVATGSDDNTVALWDLKGNKKVTLEHEYRVRAITFHPKGYMLATVSGHEAILWQDHFKPTLKQVLLRQVLKNYVIECIAKEVKPQINATQKGLLPWMANRFKLDPNELQTVWKTYPPKLQASILHTLSTKQKSIVSCTIC